MYNKCFLFGNREGRRKPEVVFLYLIAIRSEKSQIILWISSLVCKTSLPSLSLAHWVLPEKIPAGNKCLSGEASVSLLTLSWDRRYWFG